MNSSDKDSFEFLSCEEDEGEVPAEEEKEESAHKPIISETCSMIKMGQSIPALRPKFVFISD